jgi:type VI secretion system secreted protein VgrG
MAFDQSTRSLKITTPLGENAVQLVNFVGEEELSRLFSFHLSLISENAAVQGTDLVGKNLTFSIGFDDEIRFFNGFVKRFSAGDEDEKGNRSYQVVVVPWLWFLTQTSDCRIFQEMTVVEVIEKIFQDLGFSDFDMSQVKGEHVKREYWVQYRETDFNFISRLMEDEGIFYYFKHADKKHTLVMADSISGYVACREATVDYPKDDSDTGTVVPHIRSWEHSFEFNTGAWAHTDYNFKTPSTSLMSNEKTLMKYKDVTKYEFYDYPGEYEEKGTGKSLSRVRMEEIEGDHDLVSSTSDCNSFMPGGRFKVGKHRIKAEEGLEYVIQRIHHEGREDSYQTGQTGGREYFNSFECFPSATSFRPSRVTPKPLVGGVQTAVVTGPPGEEIYSDEYGRVKVQFHWDREGKKDQNTTLWIRCKQSIAGNKWGFMAIPRIGQEVVVEFLEGDPDRPLITGCVYNAEQMPHYKLPDEKTKTYIKTNSSKGGEGHNELMFEDKADEERVYIHAQKNMDVRVLNDSKSRIFGNRHQIIGWEKDGKKGGDQREMVYEDKHLNIRRHQFEHIEGNMQLLIGEGEADDGGNMDIVIEKQKAEHIKGDSHLIVAGKFNQKIDGGISQTIGGNSHSKVSGNIAQEAGSMGEVHIKAGMKVIIEAGMQLSLVGPGGFVDIGPAGVTIQGVMVKINSGGSAGSGKGCSPEEPKEAVKAEPAKPEIAHNSTSGMKSSPD